MLPRPRHPIRAARDAPAAAQDEAPAATTSPTARAGHNYDQAATAPRAVDDPDRDATLTPAQQAASVHAHQRAAMPELLESRTTDPATWMHTPEHLERLAAFTCEGPTPAAAPSPTGRSRISRPRTRPTLPASLHLVPLRQKQAKQLDGVNHRVWRET
ncbi:hypothetical protein AB5J72_00880 [Streptomyces sp. CG1]|uniref:hypothetical protein n=1 Tax=Streptomyces sp. CG1 TaxID=1287523 RepID=UPI0034E2B3C8